MPESEKLWPRGVHTQGKHLVLRNYLNAWLPILGSWNGRIVFVDGFAGPGEYESGEDGSPIIALKALITHGQQHVIRANVTFFFIESNPARAEHLRSLVDALKPELPPTTTVHVVEDRFDASMTQVLDSLEEQRQKLAPAFVMVDPFGVSGTPMAVIQRILRNPRCEVYISFMYESINRFLSTPEFAAHLDELFGTPEWRGALARSGEDRKKYLYELYADQLRESGAEHVVHFDLYDGNRLIYAIFFGTQHPKGCDLMKQAIWKVAPFGDFSFRGSHDDQLILGVAEPDFRPLMEALCREFAGGEWVTIEQVTAFVASDAVEYHTGQLKRCALRPMEIAGRIAVDEGTRKRRGTFPPNCRLRFER
jgi:three-Cys-motif partner protein